MASLPVSHDLLTQASASPRCKPSTVPTSTELTQNRLCEYCQSIRIEVLQQPSEALHAPNIETLRQNAEFCPLCRWLHSMKWYTDETFEETTRSPQQGPFSYEINIIRDFDDVGAHLRFLSADGLHTDVMSIYTFKGDVADQSFGVPTKKRLSSTASSQTIDIAAAWLNLCDTQHDCRSFELPLPNTTNWSGFNIQDLERLDSFENFVASISTSSTASSIQEDCRHASQQHERGDGLLPVRLVDLRAFSVSRPDKARLIDTAKIETAERAKKHGFYSTLSYCWGNEKFYKIERTDLEPACAGLQYSSLPRSFQDAFQITKSLGVDFMWIDALCIIQDDAEDWKTESAKMCYIYSQAAFCIAADSSSEASGGCFNSAEARQEVAENPITIQGRLSDGVESTLLVYKTARGRYEPTAVQDAPVTRRGWTYQERLLSPRILHYTSEQLFWECRKRYFAEDETVSWLCGEPGPPTTISARVRKMKSNAYSAIQTWCKKIVKEFSARAFTHPEDKLPALAGIARVYHGAFQCPYVAGIWLYQLGCGLSWYLDGEPTTAAKKPRINSFSWISVDGAVRNFAEPMSKRKEFPLSIEGYNVSPENEHDVFGAVGSCSLTLAVMLKPARLVYRQCRQCQNTRCSVISEIPGSGFVDMGSVFMDAEEQAQDIWCFPVLDCPPFGLRVLLVSPAVPQGDGIHRYRRLGLLIIYRNGYYLDDSGMLWKGCGRCSAKGPPAAEGPCSSWRVEDWFKGCERQTIILA